MKVKDLIKELQEADPTGECHVRCGGGGAVFFAEHKEGYWDGPYQYIENDEFYISAEHDKVDVQSINWQDWIWDHDGDYSKIHVDMSVYGCRAEEKQKEWLEKFEKVSKECKHLKEQLLKEATFGVLKKLHDGWDIFQESDKPIGHYNAMYYKKGDKIERLMNGETVALLESGLFHPNSPHDNINQYQWVLAYPISREGYKK